MREYEYRPEPQPEFTPVNAAGEDQRGVLHCIAMARDAIARSPLKAEWTRDAHGWLDGAVSILMRRGDQ